MRLKRKCTWPGKGCCRRRRTPGDGEKSCYAVVRSGLCEELVALSAPIEKAYAPCQTSYLDAKGQWNISCYAELDDLPDAMVPGATTHPPMLNVLEPLLDMLTVRLRDWWHSLHPEFRAFHLHRVQSFVTRYRPQCGETHLTRHVDGPHVDASCILQLHSQKGFSGGGLRVWDADGYHDHPLETGDLCLLDHLVWHQSHTIESGERWVLVVFCQKRRGTEQVCEQPSLLDEAVEADLNQDFGSGANRCQEAISLASLAANEVCKISQKQAANLVRMLSGTLDERERAAFAIGCLAVSSSENQEVLAGAGALPGLVQALQARGQRHSNERGWAAAALGRMAANNPKYKAAIADLGAIKLLADMLLCGNALEVEESASALCNLSANHDENKHLITSAGAIPALVSCLAGSGHKQQTWSAATLSNLASDAVRASFFLGSKAL